MKNGYEVVNLHSTSSGVIPVPMIGENGNWYVGNEDTGVSVKGPQGTKGEQGDNGPTGLQGMQGSQGEKGDKGDAGAQGYKGDKGDKGEAGAQGSKGDTPALAANLTTMTAGEALDATMGKVLDERITNVDSSLSGFTQKFTVLTGTAPADLNFINISYPQGFTKNNCISIGSMYMSTDGNWYDSTAEIGLSVSVGCSFAENYIKVRALAPDQRKFKIVLMRIA